MTESADTEVAGILRRLQMKRAIQRGSESSGYHLSDIPRGVYGEPGKIIEEAAEFEDAIRQNVSVMAIMELSDLVGAIRGYLARHHPSLSLDDLVEMSYITERAFQSGDRN
jgi:hypothetical protein